MKFNKLYLFFCFFQFNTNAVELVNSEFEDELEEQFANLKEDLEQEAAALESNLEKKAEELKQTLADKDDQNILSADNEILKLPECERSQAIREVQERVSSSFDDDDLAGPTPNMQGFMTCELFDTDPRCTN